MNSTIYNLDSSLAYTLRNLRNNLGSDDKVLAWLRAEYRAIRQQGVERGYGSAAALDSEAARHADYRHPYQGHRPLALAAPIVQALRLWSGLDATMAQHESSDSRLAD